MLLSFSIENFLSFEEKQELSFHSANVNRTDNPADLIENDFYKYKILPACIIYGANSSGKTNLLVALQRHIYIATKSVDEKTGSTLDYSPYKLCEECIHKPTKFDIDFIVDETRFVYELSYTKDKITHEGLFYYPKKSEARIFERNEEDEYKFGKQFKSSLEAIAKQTRPDASFLSVCLKFKPAEIVENVHAFLLDIIATNRLSKKEGFHILERQKPRAVQFLREFGLGEIDYRIDEKEVDPDFSQMASKLYQVMKEHMGEDAEIPSLPESEQELIISRQSKQGNKVDFDLKLESQGTRLVIKYMPRIFKALETGGIVIIDELDESLHTFATKHLIKIFNSKETNPKGAQLLATVHDTNLLSNDLLRKDQIIFVTKRNNASEINALSDYTSTRSTDYEKAYLEGRFEAIPNL